MVVLTSTSEIGIFLIACVNTISCLLTCKPIEIGKNLSLTHDCPDRNGDFFVWQYDSAEYPCNKNSASKAEVSYDESLRKSTFVLRNVSIDLGRKNIQIVVPRTGLKSGCLIEPYHKPESAVCRVMQTNQKSVRFECSSSKVYPGLQCDVNYWEQLSRKSAKVNHTGWSKATSDLGNGFKNVTCSIDIQLPDYGTYVFFGVLAPTLSSFVYGTAVPAKATEPLVLKNYNRTLVVYRTTPLGPTRVCHDSKLSVHFICEARNFSKKPNIHWRVGNEQYSGDVYSNGSNYVSMYSFQASSIHSGTRVFCLGMEFDDLSINGVDLGLSWVESTSVLGHLVSLQKVGYNANTVNSLRYTNVSVVCNVTGGGYFIAKIRVTCESNRTLIEKESPGAEVSASFSVGAGYSSVKCLCSASHRLNCSVQSFSFNINLTSQFTARYNNEKDSGLVDQTKFIILLACTGAVFLLLTAFIVFTLAKKKRCCTFQRQAGNSHYEDIYINRQLHRHHKPACPEVRVLPEHQRVCENEYASLYVNTQDLCNRSTE
uniref:Ig-like domain-containing protein n=1 Tax=Biomphalaria glabrata TaxID=6526 RepID=A0A2C9KQX8_BIOGL